MPRPLGGKQIKMHPFAVAQNALCGLTFTHRQGYRPDHAGDLVTGSFSRVRGSVDFHLRIRNRHSIVHSLADDFPDL